MVSPGDGVWSRAGASSGPTLLTGVAWEWDWGDKQTGLEISKGGRRVRVCRRCSPAPSRPCSPGSPAGPPGLSWTGAPVGVGAGQGERRVRSDCVWPSGAGCRGAVPTAGPRRGRHEGGQCGQAGPAGPRDQSRAPRCCVPQVRRVRAPCQAWEGPRWLPGAGGGWRRWGFLSSVAPPSCSQQGREQAAVASPQHLCEGPAELQGTGWPRQQPGQRELSRLMAQHPGEALEAASPGGFSLETPARSSAVGRAPEAASWG